MMHMCCVQVLRNLSPDTDMGQLSKFHVLTPLVSNCQYMHVRHFMLPCTLLRSPIAVILVVNLPPSYHLTRSCFGSGIREWGSLDVIGQTPNPRTQAEAVRF